MTTDPADAQVLLRVSPDDYVTERARLVKQARADGDRARANFYQSLKRPTLSLWAVLAAGDADAVHGIVTATTKLAEIQAGGSDPGALSTATQRRRKALEALVDRAVTALARSDSGAEARRAEIRGIVDQLSRHPDLAEAWIDATLRDLPNDAFGFAAFADLEVTAGGNALAPVKAHRARRTRQTPPGRTDDAAAERTEQARRDVAAAARKLEAAERRVAASRTAVREAEKAVRLAEHDRAVAERHHAKATARLEADHNE